MTTRSQVETMRAKGYLRTSEAAQRIGVTPTSILYQIKHGGLEATRIGKKWYVSVVSLAKFVGEENAKQFGLEQKG